MAKGLSMTGSKVLWHITMSVDGFVAGLGDNMSWLFGGGLTADPQFTTDLLDRVGALLIGHRTYHGGDTGQGAKTPKGAAYGGAWHGPQFVYTRDDPATAAPGFTFLSGHITGAVAAAKQAAGGKYVAILGPATARKVLDAGLLDEIIVHVAPVLLGTGLQLFNRPATGPVRLEPMAGGPEITNLWLRVKRWTVRLSLGPCHPVAPVRSSASP
jgi:dihydrofolate reductase